MCRPLDLKTRSIVERNQAQTLMNNVRLSISRSNHSRRPEQPTGTTDQTISTAASTAHGMCLLQWGCDELRLRSHLSQRILHEPPLVIIRQRSSEHVFGGPDHVGRHEVEQFLHRHIASMTNVLDRSLAGRLGFFLSRGDNLLLCMISIPPRFRENLAGSPMATGLGETIKLTVSLGVVQWDKDRMASPPSLIDAADRAMYAAKSAGRNRTMVAEGGEARAA